MRRREIRAAGELVGDALGNGVSFIHQTHRAIAGRAFGPLGAAAAPVRLVHDGVAAAAYGAVRAAHAGVPRVGAAVLAATAPPGGPPVATSPPGSVALGALNGMYGDALARRGSPLALGMGIRHRGRELTADRAALEATFPGAGGRVVVFLHGLCETDEAWRLGTRRAGGDARLDYGERLERDLGWTPLYVRYNTGLHVSDNGRELSSLLEDVVEAWPAPVDQLALVGHSMGGLVARSACHHGSAVGAAWTGRVGAVVCLGTPHLGAPLEKGANALAWALRSVPETRPLARFVNARSVGIKDLRFGSCAEEDWCDGDPDEFLRDRCREVPFLPTATYYFVAATISRDRHHPLGVVLGDLFVQSSSASGRGRRRRIPFEVGNGHHVGGLHHFRLLNHPAVYAQLRTWLQRSPAAAPAPAPVA